MGTVESCAPSKKGQEKASATSALTSLPFYLGNLIAAAGKPGGSLPPVDPQKAQMCQEHTARS